MLSVHAPSTSKAMWNSTILRTLCRIRKTILRRAKWEFSIHKINEKQKNFLCHRGEAGFLSSPLPTSSSNLYKYRIKMTANTPHWTIAQTYSGSSASWHETFQWHTGNRHLEVGLHGVGYTTSTSTDSHMTRWCQESCLVEPRRWEWKNKGHKFTLGFSIIFFFSAINSPLPASTEH